LNHCGLAVADKLRTLRISLRRARLTADDQRNFAGRARAHAPATSYQTIRSIIAGPEDNLGSDGVCARCDSDADSAAVGPCRVRTWSKF
jgi:hypothetical protein